MKITINTSEEEVNYTIDNENKKPSNDEITRAITFIEIVKAELLKNIKMDYEVFQDDYFKRNKKPYNQA